MTSISTPITPIGTPPSAPVSVSTLGGVSGRTPKSPAAEALTPARASAQPPPGQDALLKMVDAMQSRAKSVGSDLQFTVDQESGKSIVKVTERSSKDVIWQFPSEEALQVTKQLDRFQSMLSRKA